MNPHRIVIGVMGLAVTMTVSMVESAGQPPEQHGHTAPTGRVGTVHFNTSCVPAVQTEFDRGVALLHSFWFSAAIESFNTVLKGDSRCVMAHWGIAMSWWSNPFAGFRS